MNLWKLKSYPEIKKDFGNLLAVDFEQIPFPIKRFYLLYKNSVNYDRGFHAHKELKQVIFCLSGTCKILLDDGNHKEIISLNEINVALEIAGPVWREIHSLTKNSMILVLASEPYSPDDYIHNYDEFIEHVSNLT